MASIWKGSLAFGLVNIPVEAKTAVREDHISFRMLHSEDMAPDAQVIDLMARLRDSLKRDKGRGGAVRARAQTAAASEKAPARRKRATKTA